MTPDEVAERAMGALSADLRFFRCPLSRRNPCENCGHCAETKRVMADYFRLAALYPASVPADAPGEVRATIRTWGHR